MIGAEINTLEKTAPAVNEKLVQCRTEKITDVSLVFFQKLKKRTTW